MIRRANQNHFGSLVWVNILASTATLAVLFVGLRKLWSPLLAILCLGALAVNPIFLYSAGSLYSETVYTLIAILCLVVLAESGISGRTAAVAASLAAFCEREPLASSEFERRARRSIVDQCRGVQRLAAAVGALLPRHAFEPVHWQTIGDAARAAWDHRTGDTGHQHHGGEEALPPLADEDDDISSSSEEEESDFEDVELA